MEQARISVDFNEMLAPDLVLLSKTDIRTNSAGETVMLHEGLHVHVYEADSDADGKPNNLIADGAVERNVSSANWAVAAKWCCRINKDGIRHGVERQSGQPDSLLRPVKR